MQEFLQSLSLGEGGLPQEMAEAICRHHEQLLAKARFDALLEKQILLAKGRNARAITALLDTQALKQSQDPAEAVAKALEELKNENGYLFYQTQTPPPYAAGTGTRGDAGLPGPASLAEALRQRFEGK